MTKFNSSIRFTTGTALCASLSLLVGGCATRSYNESAAYSEPGSAPPMVYEAPGAVGTPGIATSTEARTETGGPMIQGNASGAERVVIPLHQEKLQVSTRNVDAGAVRISKVVKTETVSQPVTLRHEELTIQRVPAGQTQAGANNTEGQVVDLNQPFTEQTITIPLTQQEPVIQTEIVQTGQVVAQKNVSTQQTTVQHPVRTEDIQIVKIGQPQNLNIGPNLSADMTTTAGQPSVASTAQAPQASPQTPNMGTAPAYQAGTSGSAAGGPIASLGALTSAPDPAAMAGRQVQVTDAKVQNVIGNQWVEIQGPNGATVFVRSQQPVTGFSAGDTVSIRGQVQPVPQSLATLGLDQAATQALQGRPIYIQATSLQKASVPNPPANP